jgi:hypothetical protein
MFDLAVLNQQTAEAGRPSLEEGDNKCLYIGTP